MTVDLHTKEDSSLLLPYDSFLLQDTNNIKINGSVLNMTPCAFGSHTKDPLLNNIEQTITNQMHMSQSHFMLQEGHKFDFPPITTSQNLESEPSTSAMTMRLGSDLENCYNLAGMFEKMKLDERGSHKHQSEFIPSTNIEFENSHVDVGVDSYQQIRANQLSKLKQEQIVSLKEKVSMYRENHGHVFQQFQKKDQSACVGFGKGRMSLLQKPSLPQSYKNHAIFGDSCGSSGTYCNTSTNGTGVFLPRGTSSVQFDSHYRRPGKGCSTVLIPARVVQALQLHFDQIAATYGPKSPGFPPLHDVLVSNSDGMYSLQKQRQSRKKSAHIHNEMILPPEWTY